MKPRKRYTTKAKGVIQRGYGFQAAITIRGKRVILGTYSTFEEAVKVRQKAEEAKIRDMEAELRRLVIKEQEQFQAVDFDSMKPGDEIFYTGARNKMIIRYGYHRTKGEYTTVRATSDGKSGWRFIYKGRK